VTIKASSALSILAIWVTMIPAVIAEPDAWWGLIFALLATLAVGASAWRRLGTSRLLAIAGTWLGTAIAIGASSDATWMAVFAFLATSAVVYSTMRREALATGGGIAVAWLMAGAVVAANDGEGAWIGIFAFLTAAVVANSRGAATRGLAAMLWWGIAGFVMIAAGGWYWLSIIAFGLSAASIGISEFRIPRKIEWDLFERDDDGEAVR